MPYVLVIVGIILTVAGVRNTHTALFSLVAGDFTGSKSFVWWTISILGIGAVGYVEDLRKLANYFLALIFIVLVLSNKGVFAQFIAALKNPIPPVPVAGTAAATKQAQKTNTLTNAEQSLATALMG